MRLKSHHLHRLFSMYSSTGTSITVSSNVQEAWSASAVSVNKFVSTGTSAADTTLQRLLNCFGLRGKAFTSAFWISLPAAIIAAGLRMLAREDILPLDSNAKPEDFYFKVESAVWTGITGVLGFLIVFRAQQAYGRYWQALTALHWMSGEWFDSFSVIVSFCSASGEADTVLRVQRFQSGLARMFSMLHAAALLRLIEPTVVDETVGDIALLDPQCLDPVSLLAYENSKHRVELVSQWIQREIMHGMAEGSIVAAPPLVGRAYQELANGIMKYHDALKVRTICFPKDYQAVCDLLLAIHWLFTPFLVSLWVNSGAAAFAFTFFGTFTLWSLSRVAATIEVPFGLSDFGTDANFLQDRFNEQLREVVNPSSRHRPHLLWDPQSTEHRIQSVRLKELPSHAKQLATQSDADSDCERSEEVSSSAVVVPPATRPPREHGTSPRLEAPFEAWVPPGSLLDPQHVGVAKNVAGDVLRPHVDVCGHTVATAENACQSSAPPVENPSYAPGSPDPWSVERERIASTGVVNSAHDPKAGGGVNRSANDPKTVSECLP